MRREGFSDPKLFFMVVRSGSFTKAAMKLGVQPSALGHSIRGLQERMLRTVGSRFGEVGAGLSALDVGEVSRRKAGLLIG